MQQRQGGIVAAGSSTLPSNETVTLRLPSGEEIDAIVPSGLGDSDVKSYVQMRRPDLFGAPNPHIAVPNPEAATPPVTSQSTRVPHDFNPPNEVGDMIGAAAIGGPLLMGAAELGPGALKAVTKIPYVGKSIPGLLAGEAIHAARQYSPTLGKIIPSAAEWLPMLINGNEAAEEGGAPAERDATRSNVPFAGEEEIQPTQKATAPIERDATRQNVPFAGEGPARPQRLTALDQAQALKQPSLDVIDQAIPPEGATRGANLRVKAQVDFALKRGDVQGAEAALDGTASKVNSSWPPPDRPRIVPSTQNIRENDAMVANAEAQPGRVAADRMDDHALQQEMQWDLEKDGYRVESQARREFIARNSTGVTKGDLVKAARDAAKTPPGDLTQEWQKALDAIKAKSSQGQQ